MGWDFDSRQPIYVQLVRQLTQRILTGVYEPGSRLPSVRDLAQEAQVNPNTMQRAMAELEQAGLLHTERTSGRFVTDDEALLSDQRQQLAATHIAAFFRQMRALGYEPEEALALAKRQGGE
ncbi:MAG: GntR family transcriptional regulator [Oscillospiraceae bacterium]|nr:GntR family transcriptional regulator [Oscillospiraceae bacterium]